MKNSRTATLAALLALLCAGVGHAADAVARNARGYLELPLAPVLAHPETQKVLAGLPVRFGASAAGAAGLPESPVIRAMSWARPGDSRGWGSPLPLLPDGRTVALTREQTCQLALRYTLGNLAEEARQRGAKAVVDIVSNNDDVEVNSATTFECIPGMNSATVNLKGRMADVPARP